MGVEDVPLDEQETYLELWQQEKAEGPFATLCLLGTNMVFGITAEQQEEFDTNERKALGEMSFKFGRDAWKIYAQTQNALGHTMSETWFTDDA